MTPPAIGASLLTLIALSTALGLYWRHTRGRVRPAGGVLALAGLGRGDVTLLQFSTPMCSPCVGTRRLLAEIADERSTVRHVEIDLTEHPDYVRRFNILQTPTTLIVAADGSIHARINGAPRRDMITAALARVLDHN